VRDRLVEKFGASVELQKGSGGVFDVTVDGLIKFSIFKEGHFPTDDEVDAFGA
jgi:predicted Rdx family selenoprotein